MSGRAHIVLGLGFGDEGKGTIVDFLTRLHGARLVVRFNGGPQAAHNVVTNAGLHHTFAQFGSGTFAGARTHLAAPMLVEPWALMIEASALQKGVADPLSLLSIDPACPVISPHHWQLNRLRETARGAARHGSCGMGVGEARHQLESGPPVLRWRDLSSPHTVAQLLGAGREWAEGEARAFGERLAPDDFDTEGLYRHMAACVAMADRESLRSQLRASVSIFEGAQGVLLDEVFGFAPFNTWSDTTAKPAREIADGAGIEHETIGVTRTFMTRHGPGPFLSEAALPLVAADPFNLEGQWQGAIRYGHLDAVALRYSIAATGGVDALAVTHLDEAVAVQSIVAGYVGAAGECISELEHRPYNAAEITRFSAVAEPIWSRLQSSRSRVVSGSFIEATESVLGKAVRYGSHGPRSHQKSQWPCKEGERDV